MLEVQASRAGKRSRGDHGTQMPLRLGPRQMRVIIAGSRNGPSLADIFQAMRLARAAGLERPTAVLSGHYGDADFHGEKWAELNEIPVKRYPPLWGSLGLVAGPDRNAAMAEDGDALVLVWDRSSDGSRSMLELARARGLPCFTYDFLTKEFRTYAQGSAFGPRRGGYVRSQRRRTDLGS